MGEDGVVAGPPAKKRGATHQISKDDGSDSEGDGASGTPESGTFQKASEQVLAGRRIVKVRRTAASTAAPHAPNPFASIRLEASTATSAPNPFTSISLVAPASTTTSSAPTVPLVCANEASEAASSENVTGSPIDVQEEKYFVADAIADLGNDKPTGESVTKSDKQVLERAVAPKDTQNESLEYKSEGECPELAKPIAGDVQNESLDLKSENECLEMAKPILDDGKDTSTTLDTENGEGEPITEITVNEGDQDGKAGERKLDDAGKAKVEVGNDGSVDNGISNTSRPPLGLTNHRFSFGTAPSTFETPTAFASFSSTWSAFGSSNASGMGLGSGFAWNKTPSTEASGLGSTAFGSSNPISFQLFSAQSSTAPSTTAPSPQPPATSVQFQGGSTETGEEQEKVVFGADATLFEFVESSWKERGKGELRINAPIGNAGTPRLLMRSRGNFRLILNASIFPDMKMTAMDSRGVTFACVNSAIEKRDGLATYAVKFKDSVSAGNFRDAVEAQRRSPAQGGLKTPENSPSAVHGA